MTYRLLVLASCESIQSVLDCDLSPVIKHCFVLHHIKSFKSMHSFTRFLTEDLCTHANVKDLRMSSVTESQLTIHTITISIHIFLPPATKFGQGYIFTGMCDSVQGGGSGPGGVFQFFWGGLSNLAGCVSNFLGGSPIFQGGSPNFFFFFISSIFSPQKNFFWDAPTPPPETVNARVVRILLECILVFKIN